MEHFLNNHVQFGEGSTFCSTQPPLPTSTIFIFLFIKISVVEFSQELIMKTLNWILNVNCFVNHLENKIIAYDVDVSIQGRNLNF